MHVAVSHSRFLIELLVIVFLYVTVVITKKFLLYDAFENVNKKV